MNADGVDVVFNSAARGAITARIIDEVRQAVARSAGRRLDLNAMIFAFTDRDIARALIAAVEEHPDATVRVLTDWSQLSEGGARKPAALARLARARPLPRLQVRFKKDSPYRWDDEAGRPVWSHRTSRGLNHHKGLLILVDGRPERLLAGSFNWSPTAERSNFENLVVLDGAVATNRDVLRRWELEFEAFWNDGRASLTWEEAREHRRLLLAALEADHEATPEGLERGAGDDIALLADDELPPAGPLPVNAATVTELVAAGASTESAEALVARREAHGDFESIDAIFATEGLSETSRAALAGALTDDVHRVAFSARAPHEAAGDAGYAADNEEHHVLVLCDDGTVRRSPATLGAGAVDLIRRAAPGQTLELAMYVLSTRTVEYAALEEAARRGVRLRAVLNGAYNGEPTAALLGLAAEGGTDVAVRLTRRTMHEKFAVHAEGDDVFVGSANLSRSASSRHSEDRFFFKNNPAIAAAFRAEFARLWEIAEPPGG